MATEQLRRVIVRLALAMLIVVSSVGISHADEGSLDASSGRVHEHGLGLGYHTVIFRTESADTYVLDGPTIAYDYFIGHRWGFALRAAVYFPLLGSMSGPSGDFSGSLLDAYDQRHIGYDFLAMAARRMPLRPKLVLIAGGGLHVQGFALNGAAYSPVEEDSLGIGGLGKLDYAFSDWLSFSGQLALGLDFVDLVDHRNPARLVLPVSLSFAVAARY